MRQRFKNEIISLIIDEIRERDRRFMEYTINPLIQRVAVLEGLLSCAKGKHGPSNVREGLVVCSRCNEVLGKVVAPNAECKTKTK